MRRIISSIEVVSSSFYPTEQPFALIKGLEFITGSAANIWWSTNGNNPVSFAASQAVYSNLTPAEPVRLIMEGYSQTDSRPAYLGIIDFDPTQTQFPLTVVSKSLGDVLIVNADALYNRVYYRTSRGCSVVLFLLLTAIGMFWCGIIMAVSSNLLLK